MKKAQVLVTVLVLPLLPLGIGCSSPASSNTDPPPSSTDPAGGTPMVPSTGAPPTGDPGDPGNQGVVPGSNNGALDPTSVPGGPIPTCAPLPLKTPRAPKLVWTCERQNFYEKLRAANGPHWQQLMNYAGRTATANAAYGDYGEFAALVYQVTGEVTYAQKASAQMRAELRANASPSQIFTREHQADFAIIYDWIKGGIPQAERDEIEAALYGYVTHLLSLGSATEPVRLDDSDQTVGNYFGSMLLALSTPENPRSAAVLANPVFGGLDATAASKTNMRNAIKLYIENWAKGGVFVESAYYDLGTLILVGQGIEAMRTLTGTDHFPEFAGFAEQVVRAQIAQMAPNLDAAVKWGDIEGGRDVEAWRRYQTLGVYTGLLPLNSSLRPYATKFVNDLKAHFPNDPIYRGRYWYYFDPSAPTADWRADMPRTHFASGQGILFHHDGWQPMDSLFFSFMRPSPMGIDHESALFGDFQLYRKGEWALTHPIGYGGGADDPEAINSMLLGGLDSMIDRKRVGESHGADGSYTYFAASAQGDRYTPPYYMPPPAFVSEWTRSIVYLPTLSKSADSVVVYDRVNAVAPTVVDRYRGDDATRIRNAPALKQWLVHTPVAPTMTESGASWAAGSQKVELTALAPAQRSARVIDEKAMTMWPVNFPPAAERRYHIALSPMVSQPWDTFLNVLQVSDAAMATKPIRVASTDGAMEGTQLSRPGQGDAVVLFSATQASRVRGSGFSIEVTLPAAGAELYVADLDPARTWTVDGVSLNVDAAGLGHLTLTGAGARTVTVTAS